MNLTERIEENILNIPKNPKKYQKALRLDMKQQKNILDEARKELTSRNKDLASLQATLSEIKKLSAEELHILAIKVEDMEAQLIEQNKYIIETHRVLANMVTVSNESIREMVSDEFSHLFERKT